MSAPRIRGACPGLSAPMPTGDGLLVRLTPKGPIDPAAFIAFCALARQHGNGVMEITARGNIQVRGLTAQSAPLFAAAVKELDIASASPVPLIMDPLPDDPDALVDAGTIGAALAAAIHRYRLRLAPKFSVAIDGGGRLHLDAIPADVRLRAVSAPDGPLLDIAFGGDARSAIPYGTVPAEGVADVAAGLLNMIANGRSAELAGIDAVVADFFEKRPARPTPPARPPAEPIGLHPLRDGMLALGVALAFGQADCEALSQLACVARDHGARAVRPTVGRSLLLVGLTQENAERVAAAAHQLGFITRADDPRRRIAACAGKPACASGLLETRALATAIAPRLPAHTGGINLHISGCSKGCAHAAPAALTVVGDARGVGLVRNGSAAATPLRHLGPDNLVEDIIRAFPPGEAGRG